MTIRIPYVNVDSHEISVSFQWVGSHDVIVSFYDFGCG